MNPGIRAWVERAWASPPAAPPAGSWLLDIASAIYEVGVSLHRPRPRRGPIPVVSVGSIWSGGAGKTPLASDLARLAAAEGAFPAIVLRGYRGGIRRGSAVVDLAPAADAARRFGDEACLHARRGLSRVYVSPDRLLGVLAAAADGCRLALLDDGMQHRGLYRDLEIVTLPAGRPMANGRLLPRGPLRERPGAIGRADIVVLSHADSSLGEDEAVALVRERNANAEILVWSARMRFRPLTGPTPARGAAVALLTGIARPGAFRDAVEASGMRVVWESAFEDHHAFTQSEVDAALARSAAAGAGHVVVTEKDEMRLATLDLGGGASLCVADLLLEWKTAGAEAFLRDRLRSLIRR